MSEYRLFESVPHAATVRAEELFVQSITFSLCGNFAVMGTKFTFNDRHSASFVGTVCVKTNNTLTVNRKSDLGLILVCY